MVRALTASLVILLASGAASVKTAAPKTSARVVPAAYQFSSGDDPAAEHQLFDLANQARERAGVPPLLADEGLAQAAREHAAAMAVEQQISHQFADEPSLQQRLAADTNLHLDRAGENVAVADGVEQVEAALMASPPHRENLLNPAYNVAGFGVVRYGGTLYVAQDFAHGVTAYNVEQSAELVVTSANRMRYQQNLPALQLVSDAGAQRTACAMAQADSLNVVPPPAHYTLRYISMDPGLLPANASKALTDRSVRLVSAGACYGRTGRYPNGAYFVVLLLN